MAGGIPLDKAELLAMFLETFLYGIFFTLFWITLWLLKNRSRGKPNFFLIGALLFILLLSTSHVILDFIRIIEGFIVHQDPAKGGPIGYFAQIPNPLFIAKNIIYAVTSLTGDIVMAWRCYVVYSRSFLIIIFPVVVIIATVVSNSFVVKNVVKAPPGVPIFAVATPWLTTTFVLGLCANTYCTALIVYRIVSSIRSVGPRYAGHGLMPVVMALVESGALHASAWLALLSTYLARSNGQYPALDVITPLVGIVFSLIVIQIEAYASALKRKRNYSTDWRDMQKTIPTFTPRFARHPIDITVTTHQSIKDVDETQLRVVSELE